MACEWIDTTIGTQVTLQRGVDITKAAQRTGTVPVVSSGGISSFHDTAIQTGPGVVLGRKGVVGSVWFIRSDYWPHDTTLWVKDFHGNDPRFVYYFFKWMTPTITTLDVGSANPTLNRNHVHPIKVQWPPFNEQSAIAHILGTLDDKIELNRQRNQTLEAMARTLFQDWFVDFGPVRAKMEGREPYLPADLWNLFPTRLDSDGKPEGWEKKRVSDFLALDYGKSLPAGKRNHGNIPVYGSGGVTGFHDKPLINGPAIIVGRKGTIGSLYWEDGPSFPIDTVFHVRPVAPLFFCYNLLESLPLRNMNTDAAVPGLNRENVCRLEVTAPPPDLISTFANTANCLRENITAVSRDSETLTQIRDTLLPKLISGELRIRDVERYLDRAVEIAECVQ